MLHVAAEVCTHIQMHNVNVSAASEAYMHETVHAARYSLIGGQSPDSMPDVCCKHQHHEEEVEHQQGEGLAQPYLQGHVSKPVCCREDNTAGQASKHAVCGLRCACYEKTETPNNGVMALDHIRGQAAAAGAVLRHQSQRLRHVRCPCVQTESCLLAYAVQGRCHWKPLHANTHRLVHCRGRYAKAHVKHGQLTHMQKVKHGSWSHRCLA